MSTLQNVLHGLWRIGQLTSLYGFHHDDGLAVTSCYLIATTGTDERVFPVGIVNLKLYELNVRMVGKQLFQTFRRRVEGKAVVADQSLQLQLFHVVPDAKLVELLMVSLVDSMKEVEVNIARSCTFQTDVDLVLGLFLAPTDRRIQLVGQIIALARIAVAERDFGGSLRPLIDECRVEVSAASFHEGIHHLFGLFQIYVFRPFDSGQSHHPETQFHAVFYQLAFHTLIAIGYYFHSNATKLIVFSDSCNLISQFLLNLSAKVLISEFFCVILPYYSLFIRNMRKITFLMCVLCCCLKAGAQEFIVPQTNINSQGYPHVLPDNSVEFRIRSNEDLSQMKVSLDPSCRFEKQQDGFWTAHTKPLVPGFHYYWFTLGGMDISDPASKSYFGCGRMTSAIDIPEAGCDFYAIKEVPHGKVSIATYYSKVRKDYATMYVYTPASYSEDNKRYPVLYLQHGGGEDESGWTLQGKTNHILDNLIAEGKAKEMLVVMSNGNITVPGTGFGYSIQGMRGFEEELTQVIVPFVDKNFRTIADRQHRALAGLSMGGGQSFFVGLQHTELFSHIGVFSTGVFGGIRETKSFNAEEAMPGLISQHEKYNQSLKLFYISVGTDDPRLSSTRKAVAAMQQAGLTITYNTFPGDHEWQVWRKSLHDFAQKLF